MGVQIHQVPSIKTHINIILTKMKYDYLFPQKKSFEKIVTCCSSNNNVVVVVVAINIC